MNFRGTQKRSRVESVIDITALVDVVFLLIIFLLVTTTFKKKEHAFPLDLPTASESEILVETTIDRTTVYVTAAGRLYFFDAESAAPTPTTEDPISKTDLEERLRALVERNRDAEVSIQAEKDARYQDVIDIVSLCYKVGLQRVLFPYEHQEPEGAPASPPTPAPPAPESPAE